MHGEGRPKRWAAIVMLALMALTGLVVGSVAYNAGVSHGLAIGASAPDIEAGARGAVHSYGYHGYGWHPFGFGFLGPVLFLFFWFFVVRMLFWRWGGPWRGARYWHRGCGPRGFRGRGRWDRYDRYDRYDRDDDDDDDDRPRRRRDML